jgi:hypothetical protein
VASAHRMPAESALVATVAPWAAATPAPCNGEARVPMAVAVCARGRPPRALEVTTLRSEMCDCCCAACASLVACAFILVCVTILVRPWVGAP